MMRYYIVLLDTEDQETPICFSYKNIVYATKEINRVYKNAVDPNLCDYIKLHYKDYIGYDENVLSKFYIEYKNGAVFSGFMFCNAEDENGKEKFVGLTFSENGKEFTYGVYDSIRSARTNTMHSYMKLRVKHQDDEIIQKHNWLSDKEFPLSAKTVYKNKYVIEAHVIKVLNEV